MKNLLSTFLTLHILFLSSSKYMAFLDYHKFDLIFFQISGSHSTFS